MPIGLTLSDDMTRIYVRDATFEKIEIFDRLAGTSLGSFTLTDGKTKTRIWGMRPDPLNKTLILTIKRYTLQSDRWVIGPPTLVQYDIEKRAIIRTIPWPKGEEREGVNVMFSPDGKLLYMFGQDVPSPAGPRPGRWGHRGRGRAHRDRVPGSPPIPGPPPSPDHGS
jgi:hypothetical protein